MEGKEAAREDKGGKKMREIERRNEGRRRKEKERWNGVRRFLVRNLKKKIIVSYNVVGREREILKSMFYFWSVLLCFLRVDAKMGYY